MVPGGGEIAVATLALGQLMRDAVAAVPGAVVILGPPRAVATGTPPSVGLFLFHVHSPAVLATARPPHRPDAVSGERTGSLELDYVISFGGDSKFCEPEILAALVIDALATTPIVDPAAGLAELQATHATLPLPAGIGGIRVVPLTLSTTERADLWTMMSTPYQLSVEYRAQVLAI